MPNFCLAIIFMSMIVTRYTRSGAIDFNDTLTHAITPGLSFGGSGTSGCRLLEDLMLKMLTENHRWTISRKVRFRHLYAFQVQCRYA